MAMKMKVLEIVCFAMVASVAAQSSSSAPSSSLAVSSQSQSASDDAEPTATATATDSSSETASSTKSAQTHVITVGAPIGEHAFQPPLTNASVGDIIVFDFWPSNHSVVKMDPEAPCIPYDYNNPGDENMWWSNFIPVPVKTDPAPSYRIKINNTDPLYFYCSAPDSCLKYGMVAAINEPNATRLDEVKNNAQTKADFSLSPGEPIPDESGRTGSTSSSSTDSPSSSDNDDSSSLSGGAIAGIVIGAVVALALVGLLFFLIGRKRKHSGSPNEETKASAAAADAEAAAAAGGPHMSQQFGSPPMYQQDTASNRYSMVPPGSPGWADGASMAKSGHMSMGSELADNEEQRNPHRLSELASQNFEPVEMYTPGLSPGGMLEGSGKADQNKIKGEPPAGEHPALRE